MNIEKLLAYLQEKLNNGDDNNDGIKLSLDELLNFLGDDFNFVNISWLTKDLKKALDHRGFYVRYDPCSFSFKKAEEKIKNSWASCSSCRPETETLEYEQKKRERRVRKIKEYLDIYDCDNNKDNGDNTVDYMMVNNENEKQIYKICDFVIEKQNEIFSKTGKLVPFEEILQRSIKDGLKKM